MSDLHGRLLDILKPLKGSGRFACSGTAEFVFPGLEVDGLGEVSFPVNAMGAEALLSHAQQAPFGRGSDTIVDETVRKTREIDASMLQFRNPGWTQFIAETVRGIKPQLGIEGYEIEARPYKLLIYEPGSFFLPHRDSEKERGMFGTLVIELPARHTGGELVLRFDGREETISFMEAEDGYRIRYAAFYADCEHEIRPVLSGYRISLVYNLIQTDAGARIRPTTVDTGAAALAGLIREHQSARDAMPLIVLPGHQYTPENFSEAALKLHDRVKVAALMEAASRLGYYARLCLVSSFLEGSPEGGGYYGDDEERDMGEVYNEGMSIDHWVENGLPILDNITFSEDDLLAAFELHEDEPVLKESTGYMGNYGPDLTFWYHYGAVIVWSPELNARLLPLQNTGTQLDWIAHFAQRRESVSPPEREAVRYLMATGFGDYRTNRQANMNPVAGWIMAEGDQDFFNRLPAGVAQSYLSRIDTPNWLQLISFLGMEGSLSLFGRVMEDGSVPVLERLLDVLCALQESGAAPELFASQATALPAYFATALSGPDDRLGISGLESLLRLSERLRQPAQQTYELAHLLTRHADRSYIHHVLAPALRRGDPDAPLSAALRAWLRERLLELTVDRPQPPADWRREVPESWIMAGVWPLLQEFLQSPTEAVYDFKAAEASRKALERAIADVRIDVRTETIRKGSPLTLRITKTEASYERELKRWEEDRLVLAGLG